LVWKLHIGAAVIFKWCRQQLRSVLVGGMPVLLRKFKAGCYIVPAACLVILVRVLSPWKRVRVERVCTDRIGHFAGNVEIYLCKRDVEGHSKKYIDLFFSDRTVCNKQLEKMWKRSLTLFPYSRLFEYYLYISSKFLQTEHCRILHTDRDINGLISRTRQHLVFLPEEDRRGYDELEQMGIGRDEKFIGFQSRGDAYLKSHVPDRDFAYHDYRNSAIETYIPAVEELIRRGFKAARMGAVVDSPLEVSNSGIIDYATECRSDFLDIFLTAKCHFYLSDTCGFHGVPMVLRCPRIIVNMVSIEFVAAWMPNDLIIFKKHWLRDEKRFMTFREIKKSGAGRFLFSKEFDQLGIELVDNTPEEITAVVVEMDERLKGEWEADKEDEKLQNKFWSILGTGDLNKVIAARVGANYLRQNISLLE
jgi:putative glycosyltransferase (TIGR04372 family)